MRIQYHYYDVYGSCHGLCFRFAGSGKKGEVRVMDNCRIRQLQKTVVMTWTSEGSKEDDAQILL